MSSVFVIHFDPLQFSCFPFFLLLYQHTKPLKWFPILVLQRNSCQNENAISVKQNLTARSNSRSGIYLPNDTFVMVSARALISSSVESC